MLKFKRIRYKNLLATGNEFIEIDLCKTPTTLIYGSNGNGKSTLIEAISFGLYNKPFRKINKPQLLNTITNKNLVVEIEFSNYGSEYLVRRGIKPNIFEIYKDDVLLDSNHSSQEYLEETILRVSHRSSL
jgi:DNA repair exonuclease SbcCD ATPase subunit